MSNIGEPFDLRQFANEILGTALVPKTRMRSDLEQLPTRMLALPIDDRGYPVPWFVAWVDGKPEFRAMDGAKLRRAVQDRRCWVCGEPLGRFMTFVIGPMCGINRTSAEPPSHLECAEWSARNCPFLSNAKVKRREDDAINNETLLANSPGFAIARNPGVTLLWTTRKYQRFADGKGGTLFHLGEPEHVKFYANGKRATRAEVIAAVETGIPINHAEQYVRGLVHTNGLENFWALFKRCIKGTYVQIAPFHLQRYVDEEAFRFNTRKGDDAARFDAVMSTVPGRRITYRQLCQIDGCGFMGLQ